jgi:hypothetical protein
VPWRDDRFDLVANTLYGPTAWPPLWVTIAAMTLVALSLGMASGNDCCILTHLGTLCVSD